MFYYYSDILFITDTSLSAGQDIGYLDHGAVYSAAGETARGYERARVEEGVVVTE